MPLILVSIFCIVLLIQIPKFSQSSYLSGFWNLQQSSTRTLRRGSVCTKRADQLMLSSSWVVIAWSASEVLCSLVPSSKPNWIWYWWRSGERVVSPLFDSFNWDWCVFSISWSGWVKHSVDLHESSHIDRFAPSAIISLCTWVSMIFMGYFFSLKEGMVITIEPGISSFQHPCYYVR